MTFTPEQTEMLKAKLDGSHVKKRAQAGRQLSYVEGWFAISEANRIFGFDGWTRHTVELKPVHEPHQNEKNNWVVGYMARVRITVGAIVRDGCGFGSGIDRDLGRAHESALKEAETDAMKRALMTFGNPFGLALYDKEQANVENGKKPAPVEDEEPSAIADKLIEDVCAAKTGADLDTLAKHPTFKAAYNSLSTKEKARVVDAAHRHRAKIEMETIPTEDAA